MHLSDYWSILLLQWEVLCGTFCSC